jgi:hypothetical protein
VIGVRGYWKKAQAKDAREKTSSARHEQIKILAQKKKFS